MPEEPWIWRQLNRLASILQIASSADWKWWVSAAFSGAVTAASWFGSTLPWPHLVVIALLSCGGVLWILNQIQLRRTLLGTNTPDPTVTDRGLPQAQAVELTANYVRGKRISIVELTTPQNFMVKGKIFEDCDLFGPAAIAMLGAGEIGWCVFSSPTGVDDILLEIQLSRRHVEGVVIFHDCVFRGCRFFGIAIVGTREDLDRFKASLGPGK
jgi:hypothetical protein